MIILNLFHQKLKHPERIRNVLCDRFYDIVVFRISFFASEMFYAHAPCTYMYEERLVAVIKQNQYNI